MIRLPIKTVNDDNTRIGVWDDDDNDDEDLCHAFKNMFRLLLPRIKSLHQDHSALPQSLPLFFWFLKKIHLCHTFIKNKFIAQDFPTPPTPGQPCTLTSWWWSRLGFVMIVFQALILACLSLILSFIRVWPCLPWQPLLKPGSRRLQLWILSWPLLLRPVSGSTLQCELRNCNG